MRHKKMAVLMGLLILVMLVNIAFGEKIKEDIFRSNLVETLEQGNLQEIQSLNAKFMRFNKDLNFGKLKSVLSDVKIPEDIKFYYIDGFRYISEKNNQESLYEQKIQSMIGEGVIEEQMISYVLSTIKCQENIDLRMFMQFAHSEDEDIRLSALGTLARLKVPEGYDLLMDSVSNCVDKGTNVTLLTLASDYDKFKKMDLNCIDISAAIADLNLEDREQLALVLSRTENIKSVASINRLLADSDYKSKWLVYSNCINLLEDALTADDCKVEVQNAMESLDIDNLERLRH